MSMALINIYRTPTTTNARLPAEQKNGYHGFLTQQFLEGGIASEQPEIQHDMVICQ